MSDTVDLAQGSWRLHTQVGAVPSWGNMTTPSVHGSNTDVLFKFVAQSTNLDPTAPSIIQGPWYKACFLPGDEMDTEAKRGPHWARLIPAADNEHPLVQIVQAGYHVKDAVGPNTTRIFIGRWVAQRFFGHGAGNEGIENLSFTLTQE